MCILPRHLTHILDESGIIAYIPDICSSDSLSVGEFSRIYLKISNFLREMEKVRILEIDMDWMYHRRIFIPFLRIRRKMWIRIWHWRICRIWIRPSRRKSAPNPIVRLRNVEDKCKFFIQIFKIVNKNDISFNCYWIQLIFKVRIRNTEIFSTTVSVCQPWYNTVEENTK